MRTVSKQPLRPTTSIIRIKGARSGGRDGNGYGYVYGWEGKEKEGLRSGRFRVELTVEGLRLWEGVEGSSWSECQSAQARPGLLSVGKKSQEVKHRPSKGSKAPRKVGSGAVIARYRGTHTPLHSIGRGGPLRVR